MIPIEKIIFSPPGCRGLKPFIMDNLRKVVILTGPNGSGKTRLLNLLADYLENKNLDEYKCFSIYPDNPDNIIKVSNFSHYDAPLQLPSNFPYYVVTLTNERLEAAEFANIDKEALLYIQCIAQHDKEKFEQFNEFLVNIMDERILYDNDEFIFFDRTFENMNLSPGQNYLLRLCVTLFCNQEKDSMSEKSKRILLLDEPEMHLHPGVLLKALNEIRKTFNDTQIWIATHSITLLSQFDTADIWYMERGKPKPMGSNSYSVLQGLLADGIPNTNYGEKLEYFIQLPNIFALCEFAKESLTKALSLPLKEKTDKIQDPQIKFAKQSMENELNFNELKTKKKVLDFGAGKGRFLEGLTKVDIEQIEYFAYNNINETTEEDKNRCKMIMSNKIGCEKANESYFEKISELQKMLKNSINCVLLMNVLHEIEPAKWETTLKHEIKPLLLDGGKLVIIEVEELNRGENASSCGFLVLTEKAAEILFCSDKIKILKLKNTKKGIIGWIVDADQIDNICPQSIKDTIISIQDEALQKIKEIRNRSDDINESNFFKHGIHHAFWLHQYANAAIAFNHIN